MDSIKIGKFIAEKRKAKNLTQLQLAERLYVTDRAVSKWERGLSLPDAGKMINLCNILGINVNELLIGEKLEMKDMNKKTDELLVELSKQEEISNKKIMVNMWVMLITAVLLVLVAFYAFGIEVKTGYYECHKCHHKFIPNFFTAFICPHINLIRLLKCPECHKWSWAKKVMKK